MEVAPAEATQQVNEAVAVATEVSSNGEMSISEATLEKNSAPPAATAQPGEGTAVESETKPAESNELADKNLPPAPPAPPAVQTAVQPESAQPPAAQPFAAQPSAAQARAKRKYVKRQQRRAPLAPKRAKSAYIFFSMKHRDKVTDRLKEQGHENPKVTEIMTALASDWRVLDENARRPYVELAEQDKERYTAETKAYSGPLRIPNKRVKKDSDAPKRPMPAFLHWAQAERPKLRKVYPDLKNTDISKKLGEVWQQMADEDKKPHLEAEAKMREFHKKEMEAWNAKAPQRAAVQRAKQEEEINQHKELQSLLLAQQAQHLQENAAVLLMMQRPDASKPPLFVGHGSIVGDSVVFNRSGVGNLLGFGPHAHAHVAPQQRLVALQKSEELPAPKPPAPAPLQPQMQHPQFVQVLNEVGTPTPLSHSVEPRVSVEPTKTQPPRSFKAPRPKAQQPEQKTLVMDV